MSGWVSVSVCVCGVWCVLDLRCQNVNVSFCRHFDISSSLSMLSNAHIYICIIYSGNLQLCIHKFVSNKIKSSKSSGIDKFERRWTTNGHTGPPLILFSSSFIIFSQPASELSPLYWVNRYWKRLFRTFDASLRALNNAKKNNLHTNIERKWRKRKNEKSWCIRPTKIIGLRCKMVK